MAHDKFNDKFTEPTVAEPTAFSQYATVSTGGRLNGKATAQGAFWQARDAISEFVLADTVSTGCMPIDHIVADCLQLPEVHMFKTLAGNSEMLQQLYKHWINDAISSALKQYINQKP